MAINLSKASTTTPAVATITPTDRHVRSVGNEAMMHLSAITASTKVTNRRTLVQQQRRTRHTMLTQTGMLIPRRYKGNDQVHVASGAGLPISHLGHSSVVGSRPLHLKNILHVPKIDNHHLSIHKLACDNNAFFEFHPNSFCIKDQVTKKILLEGICKGGLYPLPSAGRPYANKHQSFISSKISQELWHQRLGHPSSTIVSAVLQSHNISSVSKKDSHICDVRQQAKIHQLPSSLSSCQSNAPLELIHSDVWGPTITSVGGSKYYVSFLDDYSRFTWFYLLKHKFEVERVFIQFKRHVECLLGTKIKQVQSDWGGEYQRLHRHLTSLGISHRVSCPHTYQQNGIAE